jgi:hypothetical protein
MFKIFCKSSLAHNGFKHDISKSINALMGLVQTEGFQAVLHIGETSGLNVCHKVVNSRDK